MIRLISTIMIITIRRMLIMMIMLIITIRITIMMIVVMTMLQKHNDKQINEKKKSPSTAHAQLIPKMKTCFGITNFEMRIARSTSHRFSVSSNNDNDNNNSCDNCNNHNSK
jgi:hypothetical protein